jgi:plasmid stability protein
VANVLIRDIPDEVMKRFKSMAKRNKRSLQQELKMVLENTANHSSSDIFLKTSQLRERLRKKARRFTDSAELLRKDRSR